MKALKKSDIVQFVAKDMEIPPTIIESVANSYWRELGEAVRGLRFLNILVHGIGELRIAKTRLEKSETYIKNNMEKLEPGSKKHTYYVLKLERIQELKRMRQEEYDKRARVKQKRQIYDQFKKDLEK